MAIKEGEGRNWKRVGLYPCHSCLMSKRQNCVGLLFISMPLQSKFINFFSFWNNNKVGILVMDTCSWLIQKQLFRYIVKNAINLPWNGTVHFLLWIFCSFDIHDHACSDGWKAYKNIISVWGTLIACDRKSDWTIDVFGPMKKGVTNLLTVRFNLRIPGSRIFGNAGR